MKRQKANRIKRIKEILDKKLREDKKNKKKAGRSLGLWLEIINFHLPSPLRPINNRELSGLFKFFNFIKSTTETTEDGCFRRIVFYRYQGGYKNGNTKKNINK